MTTRRFCVDRTPFRPKITPDKPLQSEWFQGAGKNATTIGDGQPVWLGLFV